MMAPSGGQKDFTADEIVVSIKYLPGWLESLARCWKGVDVLLISSHFGGVLTTHADFLPVSATAWNLPPRKVWSSSPIDDSAAFLLQPRVVSRILDLLNLQVHSRTAGDVNSLFLFRPSSPLRVWLHHQFEIKIRMVNIKAQVIDDVSEISNVAVDVVIAIISARDCTISSDHKSSGIGMDVQLGLKVAREFKSARLG